MRRIPYFKLLAALAALFSIVDCATAQVATTSRIMIRPKDTTAQTIEAEAIVVGKVGTLEKQLVNATQTEFANAPKVDFQVATIQISEGLIGTKGLTTIRVGWQAAPAAPAPNTNPAPINQPQPAIRPTIRPLPGRNMIGVALNEGQEGCFFLKKHFEGDFYVAVANGKPIEKSAENFATELETVKKILKIIENPVSALKAKETDDRNLAASVLVRKYRTFIPTTNGQPAKQEEIPAEESKLILQTISELDWNNVGGVVDPKKMFASQMFYQLGVQPADGYTQPKFEQGKDNNKIVGDYTTKWLKDNAEKYRIKKYVK
jgi:hypothetical protein